MRPTTRGMTTSYGGAGGSGLPSRAGMGTAARPIGTSRLATGMTSSLGRQAAVGAVIQQAQINVTDRPTTTQGMRGMSSRSGPMQRSTQDATFYVGVLRQKVNEITAEISKLQRETEEVQRDQSMSSNMQRRVEDLDKEVRNLEGTLADYNIAMDKLRQGSDASELKGYIQEYEAKNRVFAQEIDRIFLQTKQEEAVCQTVEQQIEGVYQKNQAKINSMDPGRLQQYQELLHQSQALQERSAHMQAQIDSVTDQIALYQAQRDANSCNQEFQDLEDRGMLLQRQLQSLMEEQEISRLEPGEMQQRMLAKVKADNARAAALDEEIKQLRDESRRQEQTVSELKAEVSNGGKSDKDKYEKLYQRDREMTEFIDGFDETKKAILNEQKEAQETIVGLLAHISKGLEAEGNMPSQERLQEMHDEASFKEKQLESSQATMQRLQKERELRLEEMEKIKNLDEKIGVELEMLRIKMESMSTEMVAFDDLDDLRRRAAETKKFLNQQFDTYGKRMKAARDQVAGVRRKYESTKKQLEEHETQKKMIAQEKKLKSYAQNIFSLQEYIETQGRESDFIAIKDSCMALTSRVNEMVKENMTNQSQNLSEAPISGPQW